MTPIMDTGATTDQITEDDFKTLLPNTRVAIWGLGLMGGSLALALKGKCASIIGIDTDEETLHLAQEQKIVDRVYSMDSVRANPVEILNGIDLIILAVPVRAILRLLDEIPMMCPAPAVILDLGSTKVDITRAMEGLPDRFDPIGGHPMCGKEKSSLRFADGELFKGAPFALVALERTTSRARALVIELIHSIQGCPLWLPADIHDRWVTSTSHLPFLTAWALTQATPEEAAPLVGPGFRSSTRLAGSSSQMMVDILATNKDNIRTAIQKLVVQLQLVDKMMEQEDFEGLRSQFELGAEQHQRLAGGI